MDVKQVRSFLAVANCLSFSRAARQIHLSQAALSAQIQSLEAHLGVQLLLRNRRAVRLTEAGEAFLKDGEALLQHIADIELRAARIGSGDRGHLRIGFVASATMQVIPAVALALRKQHPDVTLELRNIPTSLQIDALKSGSIDAGFLRMPFAHDGLTVEPIHTEPFAMVVSKSHPLAKSRSFEVEQLAGQPFIAYGRRWAPAFYDHWTEICRGAGFTPTVVQETAEMDTALVLVAAGLGVAILPEGITRRGRSTLRIRSLSKEKIRSVIGIATCEGRETPLLRNLLAAAKRIGGR